jgi:hypothetical protein
MLLDADAVLLHIFFYSLPYPPSSFFFWRCSNARPRGNEFLGCQWRRGLQLAIPFTDRFREAEEQWVT